MSAGFVHEGELWIFADGPDDAGELIFDPYHAESGYIGGAYLIPLLSERLGLSERMEANDVDPTGDLRIGRVRITVEVLEHSDQLRLEPEGRALRRSET